jgi:hypothetical protein
MNKAMVLLLIILSGCSVIGGGNDIKEKKQYSNPLMLKVLPWHSYPELEIDERWRRKDLFKAVDDLDAEEVREYLAQGYDPDKCLGVTGWASTNPLNALMLTFYNTYHRIKWNEAIPSPPPDVAVLYALIEGGADINRFPFIWYRIHNLDNHLVQQIIASANLKYKSIIPRKTLEEAQEEAAFFIKDANRLIEAFLELGADPDKSGHPYPYGYEVLGLDLTDEEANAYFAQGSRPVNEAIKKGMVWESQVDLLLRYTSLDEESLEAAQESNDPAMIRKINLLWIEQRQGG